jgi:hypothetical protein
MPNTLVHFAMQRAASAPWWRRVDARWIYLGCLLPDIPWILRRAVVAFGLPGDAVDLRLYTMAQASLAGTLLLCAALAAASAAPRLVFGVLGANALLHLLLDACEIKWGNGVHLVAPFSWQMTRFEWIASDASPVLALAVLGGLVALADLVRPAAPVVGFARSVGRWTAAAAFLAAYFVLPIPFLPAIEASDSYSTRTIREIAQRPGRRVSLDRTVFQWGADGAGYVWLWTGERIRAVGPLPPQPTARVSFHGTFLASDVVRIDSLKVHRGDRDLPTYLGLLLLGLLWIRPTVARRVSRGRTPEPRPTAAPGASGSPLH